MNQWSKVTLKLVRKENYLDRLVEVYPHEEGERDVDEDVLKAIRSSFESKNKNALLNQLLDLNKFPYKESYVAFLRRDRDAIKRNPKTVKRICDHLYKMGVERVIEGAITPKEANTRRGPAFATWTRKEFAWVDIEKFESSKQGIVILDASEQEAMEFCNKEMGVGIAKRPDLVAKAGSKYVIGEAKFLSSTGGNQDRAFEDGMKLANNSSGNAYKVFVLDGFHWIDTGSDAHQQIVHSAAPILSALLLKDFLKNLSRRRTG